MCKVLEASITMEEKGFKLSLSKEIKEKIGIGKIYTDCTTGDELIYLTASNNLGVSSLNVRVDEAESNKEIEINIDELVTEKLGDSVTQDFDSHY